VKLATEGGVTLTSPSVPPVKLTDNWSEWVPKCAVPVAFDTAVTPCQRLVHPMVVPFSQGYRAVSGGGVDVKVAVNQVPVGVKVRVGVKVIVGVKVRVKVGVGVTVGV